MSAIDNILNFKKDEEDFYAILGCDENSTCTWRNVKKNRDPDGQAGKAERRKAGVEQIIAEYKVRALQYHPDKNDGNKEAEAKFQKMKEAKETLCDPEKRSNYDKWRNSGISVSYKQWLGMKEHVHQSMHWATHKTKDRMLPEGLGSAAQRAASSGPPGAHRRASEGGANIHWGGRGNVQWDSSASSEVVHKFRNYEI